MMDNLKDKKHCGRLDSVCVSVCLCLSLNEFEIKHIDRWKVVVFQNLKVKADSGDLQIL